MAVGANAIFAAVGLLVGWAGAGGGTGAIFMGAIVMGLAVGLGVGVSVAVADGAAVGVDRGVATAILGATTGAELSNPRFKIKKLKIQNTTKLSSSK